MVTADGITIARFNDQEDANPKIVTLTWAQLAGLLSTHQQREDKDGPLWSPTEYAQAHRADRNVHALTALVFDFDHGAPDWQLLAPYAYVAHTTWRHTAQQPRWRVVLPMTQRIAPAEWALAWEGARQLLAPNADDGVGEPSRMYYLPACPMGSTGDVRKHDGAAFDPNDLPEPPAHGEDEEPEPAAGDGERPGDRFNRETTWTAILEPHLWERGEQRGDTEVWIRPGKGDPRARSANTTPRGNLWVWSSAAAPFEPGRSYTKFAAFALLEYGGDMQAAARELARRYDPVIHFPPRGGNQAPADESDAPPPWPDTLSPLALHGLAGDFVRTVDPHTEADSVAILAQFLVAFGNVVGRGPHLMVEQTRHGLNEFCGIVGETAKARKGTSARHVTHLFELAALFGGDRWIHDRRKDGLSSGEGLIWNVRDPIEETKPIKDSKTKSVTYQRTVTDEGVHDKRLLIEESELSSTLRVLSRDGNTLSPVIRKAWDGNNVLSIMTKNFPAMATNAHISIIGHITQEELRRDLTMLEGANGFANRFLWVCVRRSKELPYGGALTDAALSPLARRLYEAITFGTTERLIIHDEEVRTASWPKLYHELTASQPGLVGAVTARSEPHVLRLACIYALLDLSIVVRQEHMLAAYALWDYCQQSAGVIFGASAEGDPTEEKIRVALSVAGATGLRRTELRDVFQRHITTKDLQSALDRLAERGIARMERTQAKSGPPTERWFLC